MIKNRDGTEYELRKPNPNMVGQALWSLNENYELYNCYWEPVIVTDVSKKIPTIKPKIIRQEINPLPEELPQQVEAVQPQTALVAIWCLPAYYKEYRDDLYGERYKTVKYGKKFMFDAEIIEESDLQLTIKTSSKEVTVGSVLYPRIKEKRWWRVGTVEVKDGVLFASCIISDFQPDFS